MDPIAIPTEHPIAALLPDMTDEEYGALCDDIRAHGLLVPIALYDGQVLDGHHRLRACREVGIEPRFEAFAGDDPLSFVVAANVHRRHLSAAQRAALAVEILPMIEEAARRRQVEAGGDARRLVARIPQAFEGRSRQQAAAITGVSGRYVSEAKRIAQTAPDVLEAVKTGRLDLATAKAAADLPEDVGSSLLSGLRDNANVDTRSDRLPALRSALPRRRWLDPPRRVRRPDRGAQPGRAGGGLRLRRPAPARRRGSAQVRRRDYAQRDDANRRGMGKGRLRLGAARCWRWWLAGRGRGRWYTVQMSREGSARRNRRWPWRASR